MGKIAIFLEARNRDWRQPRLRIGGNMHPLTIMTIFGERRFGDGKTDIAAR
jgi:hypothetical protein